MSKFIIQDWAGNRIEPGLDFESFEDAWEHILGDLTNRLNLTEEDYQEYYAVPYTGTRTKRYLDPRDPRGEL
jgi:hypothetical protein